MVSSSRKKNKGRDRKAKKAEAERARVRNIWLEWTTGEDKKRKKVMQCDHGCGSIPNDLDHPVSKFLDDFVAFRDANHNNGYTAVDNTGTMNTRKYGMMLDTGKWQYAF